MAITFRSVTYGPLQAVSVSAPDGAIIGLIGLSGSGIPELLELAIGRVRAEQGGVDASGPVSAINPGECAEPAAVVVASYAAAGLDAADAALFELQCEQLRRKGASILLADHDIERLRRVCDEVWWFDGGRLAAKGDTRDVIPRFERHVREVLQTRPAPSMPPGARRGDGRAELLSVETLNEAGQLTAFWGDGEPVSVRLTIRFRGNVHEPVAGIMIRNRIGLEVYGTNTELEAVKFGPLNAGDVVTVTFSFRCDLCPQIYTVTAASHDPDGSWHDWIDDAVSVTVRGVRYTAGIANLRAQVTVAAATSQIPE